MRINVIFNKIKLAINNNVSKKSSSRNAKGIACLYIKRHINLVEWFEFMSFTLILVQFKANYKNPDNPNYLIVK